MWIKILIKIAVNATALYAAGLLINGFSIEKSIAVLAFAGIVLWLGTTIVRPLLKILTFPLMLITFGLFNIIINMLILWGVAFIVPQLEIAGIVPLFMATILISLINSALFFI